MPEEHIETAPETPETAETPDDIIDWEALIEHEKKHRHPVLLKGPLMGKELLD